MHTCVYHACRRQSSGYKQSDSQSPGKNATIIKVWSKLWWCNHWCYSSRTLSVGSSNDFIVPWLVHMQHHLKYTPSYTSCERTHLQHWDWMPCNVHHAACNSSNAILVYTIGKWRALWGEPEQVSLQWWPLIPPIPTSWLYWFMEPVGEFGASP